MRKLIFLIALAIASLTSRAQSANLKQRKQILSIQNSLDVDSIVALRIFHVRDNYKTELERIVKNSMVDSAKRAAVKMLIIKRNRELRSFLTTSQSDKLIPSTERFVQK